MTTIGYTKETLALIELANRIISQYCAEGLKLTLRQLYYRFVFDGYFPNTNKSYKRLEGIINDGRLAGAIDREAIVDRVCNVVPKFPREDPKGIIEIIAKNFTIDKWKGQYYRPEIWTEKESIAKVLALFQPELGVPYFIYWKDASQSIQRMLRYHKMGLQPVILHLGDHNPSGVDITQEISVRLEPFKCPVKIERIALNKNQVEKYDLPPNAFSPRPSKNDTWELDALEPRLLINLVTKEVLKYRHKRQWDVKVEEEKKRRGELKAIADNYKDVVEWLNKKEVS